MLELTYNYKFRKFFLFLNGISIVVVIIGWLRQYVINLTKLVHA